MLKSLDKDSEYKKQLQKQVSFSHLLLNFIFGSTAKQLMEIPMDALLKQQLQKEAHCLIHYTHTPQELLRPTTLALRTVWKRKLWAANTTVSPKF